jgi:hypothetical protein
MHYGLDSRTDHVAAPADLQHLRIRAADFKSDRIGCRR